MNKNIFFVLVSQLVFVLRGVSYLPFENKKSLAEYYYAKNNCLVDLAFSVLPKAIHEELKSIQWHWAESYVKQKTINKRDSNGQTLLMKAICAKQVYLAQLLLDYGADPWIKDINGKNAYDYAKSHDMHQICAKRMQLYQLTHDPIDVVIPCHEKDSKMLDRVIQGIRTYCKHVNRIIIVSSKQLTEQVEWFNEARYPFSKQDILSILTKNHEQKLSVPRDNNISLKKKKNNKHGGIKKTKKTKNKSGSHVKSNELYIRNGLGWFYQQLLKLYAPFVIPDISPNVLVIDADVIFLNDIEFIDAHGCPLMNIGTEYHEPYFNYMKKLILVNPLCRVYNDCSGITHHMLLQKPIIEDLFKNIYESHNMEPWQAIIHCLQDLELESLSEYEIYFNFICSRTPQVKIRQLKWANIKYNEQQIKNYQDAGFHYVACHGYLG